MLPTLEEGLEDVAFVELAVAQQSHHAPRRRIIGHHLLKPQVVLRERGEGGNGDAEADRSGREIDVVRILGARGVGLGAAEAPEALELVARLPAEQVLDGVIDRARMGFDRDPVLRVEDVEIERRQQGYAG